MEIAADKITITVTGMAAGLVIFVDHAPAVVRETGK